MASLRDTGSLDRIYSDRRRRLVNLLYAAMSIKCRIVIEWNTHTIDLVVGALIVRWIHRMMVDNTMEIGVASMVLILVLIMTMVV